MYVSARPKGSIHLVVPIRDLDKHATGKSRNVVFMIFYNFKLAENNEDTLAWMF